MRSSVVSGWVGAAAGLSVAGSAALSFSAYSSGDGCGLQYLLLFPAWWLAVPAVPALLVSAVCAESDWRRFLAGTDFAAAVVAVFIALTPGAHSSEPVSDTMGAVLASGVLVLLALGWITRATASVVGQRQRG